MIVFVGHPLEEDVEVFEELGKRLKINNVAIDIINFANPDNIPKLEALVSSANQGDNCNFLNVPLGVTVLTDVLFTSPILSGDMAAGMGAGAAVADGSGGMVMDQIAGGVPA